MGSMTHDLRKILARNHHRLLVARITFRGRFFRRAPGPRYDGQGTDEQRPIGTTFVSSTIQDALMQGPGAQIEVFHGYSSSGHPAACAVGPATQIIYRRDGLLMRYCRRLAGYNPRASGMSTMSCRSYDRPDRPNQTPAPLMSGWRESLRGLQRLLPKCTLVRVTGGVISLSPLLIVARSHIDQIASILADALKELIELVALAQEVRCAKSDQYQSGISRGPPL